MVSHSKNGFDIDPTVPSQIASRVEVLSDGHQHDFPLSIDPKDSLDEINEKYICSICKRVPITPCLDTRTECSQHFCVSCLHPQRQQSKKCPACDEFLFYEDDTRVMDLSAFSEMKFRCQTPQCEEQFTVNEYVQHMKQCTLGAIPCTFACGNPI